MTAEPNTLYFAYGSNLDKAAMRHRCPGATPVGAAKLKDWQLVFRGVCDIEDSPGSVTFGAVWQCSAKNMGSLDAYEGVAGGFYSRRIVSIEMLDTGDEHDVIVYVMNPSETDERSLPAQAYLQSVARGYRDFDLPRPELEYALGVSAKRVLSGEGVRAMCWDGRKRMKPVKASKRGRAKFEKPAKHQRPEPRQRGGRPNVYEGMSPATIAEMEMEKRAEQARLAAAPTRAELIGTDREALLHARLARIDASASSRYRKRKEKS